MTQLAIDTANSEWAAGPGTDDGTVMGIKSTSKIGFCGTAPIALQTLDSTASTGSTVGDVVQALAALGLVIDSAA